MGIMIVVMCIIWGTSSGIYIYVYIYIYIYILEVGID